MTQIPPKNAASKSKGAAPPPAEPLAFPASFAQQRLWFLHYLEPGVASYNLPIALRLKGQLDAGALEESLNEILRRHDALRTSFPVRDGVPVQVVAPLRQVDLQPTDLGDIPAEGREQEASRLVSLEASRPFDLASGPLLRAKLFGLDEESHVLVVTTHHIVSDGWSIDIFMKELALLYEAFRKGQPSPLPDLPIQYADYALWQKKWLRGEVLEAQLDYWRKQLAGIPALLGLPTDRPRSAVPSYRGASVSAILAPGILQGLKALARQESATLFMVLLAAFQALLSRYTGEDDIAVGSPIAGRTQQETEPLIGFFVNTLVLRGDLSGDPTFRQVVGRVRETALQAYAFQDLPFEKLVEELQPARTLTHTPLFQVLFQLTPVSGGDSSFADLTVSNFPLGGEIAKFDLSLRMIARPDRLSCVFDYKTDLFDAETIKRMMGHWQIFLSGLIAEPDRPISRVPIMDDIERQRVLSEWNATSSEFDGEKGIAEAFAEQADSAPDAPALVSGEETISYGDLNRRANRLAHHLRARGVEPGQAVGVCLERSAELVVALLGILKAGAFYVPLDPSYPSDRIEFMTRDASVRCVVTDAGSAGPLGGNAAVVRIDVDAAAIAAGPDSNPPASAAGDSTAYVIYTSGSTGSPKGVAVPHRGVLRLVRNVDYARLAADEVFLQLAPASFDASTFEIWGALLNGARCVLFPARVPTPADLRRTIAEHGVSILWLTASLFNAIVDADVSALTGVRQLLIGGEALSVPHVRRALEALPGTRIINGYGPTESTTFACAYPIPRDLPERAASIPIGRPISNTRVYILDRQRVPVPIGVPGELYIGGAGLASRYLNNPELTAEKFVPDPFHGAPGDRLYRTGDRVRHRPDGNIEFLGRLDKQLKIRGFRIEPAEVEAALTRHPDVASAFVVAREDLPGDRRLIAYIVRRDAKREPVPDLRRMLAATLPDYMIPSAIVVLVALPLIASGKIDWRALPRPGLERSELKPDGALPRDTLELVLLKIWEEVLGIPSIGATDDFFALGGHSLLAVRLFSEIEKTFGRNLPLATLFQAPTVQQLAARLREDGWEAPWSSLVVIQGGAAERPPFLCVPGVGGNILGFYDLARQLGTDQPVYGLQAQGLDGQREPLTRIEDMAAHYISEVRAVLPKGPFLVGGASFGGSVAFEMARQLDIAGYPVALVALFDAFAPGTAVFSPRLAKMRRKWKRRGERFVVHAKHVIFDKDRAHYLRSKSRTLRRRIRSRIWQMIYKSYRERSKPLPRVFQDVREAGYLANREYVPGPYRGKVTLFRAGVRSAQDAPTSDMGWARLAQGGVEVCEVPGDHVNMLLRPQVGLLARQLREAIDRALGKELESTIEKIPGEVRA
ncbi:MAG: amino acid adenylation domain-containing protein [Acidobacteriota bacterium]